VMFKMAENHRFLCFLLYIVAVLFPRFREAVIMQQTTRRM
jgi:hypothetical protein